MPTAKSKYDKIIEAIFAKYYAPGVQSFEFTRDEVVETAEQLDIARPKNIGDVLYTYRYRRRLPITITATAPEGYHWIIRSSGIARYNFVLTPEVLIAPALNYMTTKIPDATPGIIRRYAMNDEQALLAVLRYNRLIDIFTGLTCYSLQNHLRTTVVSIGQVETDELYVGVDKHGIHYIIPVQAKGGNDRIGPVQIEQDFAVCKQKFPELICRPIAAQFMDGGAIALFEFVNSDDGIRVASERHYKLVPPDDLTSQELATYRQYASVD
jgi:hypothetical protein